MIFIIKIVYISAFVVSVNSESLAFYFYCQGNVIGVNVDDFKDILNDFRFNRRIPTVLYIHGFTETQSHDSIRSIVSGYELRNRENLICLDWSIFSSGISYFQAIRNIETVAIYMANILITMSENGLDISKFHIVGHSLGAQLAGSIGRKIQQISQDAIQVPRISGLDPANPMFTSFETWFTTGTLRSSDALFVDIIHTDIGFYGTIHSKGHVNFFPNGGRRYQPGCPITILNKDATCSHRRSWIYWAESLRGDSMFIGTKAFNYFIFLTGRFRRFRSKDFAIMGPECSKFSNGNYYFKTAKMAPFALGIHGS